MSTVATIRVTSIAGVPFLNHRPGVIAKLGSFSSRATR